MSATGGGGERARALDTPFWLTRSWWRRTGKASIAIVVATGLSFVAAIVVARGLGPAGLGAVVLATVTVVSVATFLDFSLEEAVVHHGARALAEGRPGALWALLRTSLRIDAGVGLAVFVALMFVATPIASLVSRGMLEPTLIRLAAVEILATTVNGTTGAALLLSGRPELRAWAMAWTGLLRLVAVLIAVRAGGAEAVLWAYAGSSAAGAVSQGILAWRVGRRRWGRGRPEDMSPVSPRGLASFGMHSSLTTSVVAIRLAVVSIVLGRSAGPVAVGVLGVAMFPVTLAGVLTAPLRMTAFPEKAKLAAEGRRDVVWRGVRGYTLVSLSIGIPAAAIGWFLLPWLLPALYSSGFEASVAPARVLLVAALAFLCVAWAKALPAAVGRPNVRTLVSLADLVITGAAIVALGSRGAMGAAIAISGSSAIISVVWWAVARRLLTPA